MKFAGLDIGTTTISGVLLDAGSGICLKSITQPNTAHWPAEQAWQEPDKIFKICLEILAKLAAEIGQPDGLGLTGQMHGVLYIDGRGQALSPLFSWQDGRGDEIYQDQLSYAEHLSKLTGHPMATGFGLTTHYFNVINGLVPKGAVSIVTITDYVAMRFCGLAEPVMHPSMAHSLGLFDLDQGQFDPEAMQAAGIRGNILPQVSAGEMVLGKTGDGIPVTIPIGDNQASFLGSVQAGSDILVNIGTGSQISILSEKIRSLPPLETRPYIEGHYLLVGSALCGGSAYGLLRDFFKAVLQDFGGQVPQNLYEQMAEMGDRVYPEDHPLMVDTRFKGTRTDPGQRGSIRNISMDNFTPGHLVIGVLRGMVEELKDFYDRLPQDLQHSEGITGSGNAIRRNALLRRMIEDQFGKKVHLPAYQEEGAVGAARLAQTMVMQDL